MALFALLMLAGWHPGDWLDAYDYARIFSPLLLLVGLRSWNRQAGCGRFHCS
jgi:hypothetical protein